MRTSSSTARRFLAFAAAIALLAASIAAGATAQRAIAQDETSAGHPSHFHTGTCEQPGEITVPLGNIGTEYINFWDPAATVEPVGSEAAVTVISASTPIDAPLSAFIGSEHILMVHESEDTLQNFIACGNVGGNLVNGTDLQFGIEPLNNSGVSGVAWLIDDGDGTSTLHVFLVGSEQSEAVESASEATPGEDDTAEQEDEAEADDASAEGAATTHEVDITDFSFTPSTLEVRVGDTVTWTNNDAVPHTATQDPAGSGFQSGTIASGGSFSHTFEDAGEFAYFCEFHPNMTGTVVVTE
jgi:plastocyanin